MSAAAQRTRILFTEEEYLAKEAASRDKHEFLDGDIYAMAGGSLKHGGLCTRVIVALVQLTRCQVFTSDVRVHIAARKTYTYPDASVVCGKPQRAPKDPCAITNPILLVEVLSPSTEDYDLGEKFDRYRSIPSLKAVVFVSQTERLVQYHARTEVGQWNCTEARADQLPLPVLSGKLDVDALYEGIELLESEPGYTD